MDSGVIIWGGGVFGILEGSHGGGWGYRKFIANEIPFRGGVIRYYVLHSLRGGGSSKLYHNTNKILPPPPATPRLYIMTSHMIRSDRNMSLE